MARFDVYAHPDLVLRKKTPFLVDVQNNFIDRIASRIVIPMRNIDDFGPCMRDLNPIYQISGKKVVLDTAALAAFPASGLKKPVSSLWSERNEIVAALDTLFGSF
jgi:toxin CcdB